MRLGVIVMITFGTTIGTTATILLQQQQVQAAMTGRAIGAPMATSGDNNVYVVWWTNKS
jgi:hypothetical protein